MSATPVNMSPLRAFFSFCCDQVALCRVSVLAAGAAPAITHSSGVPARRVDHHAHFGGVGGTVPTESHRGSFRTAGGIRGKAGPCESAGEPGIAARCNPTLGRCRRKTLSPEFKVDFTFRVNLRLVSAT